MATEQAEQDSRFSETQYDEAYPPGVENSWWFHARGRIIASALREQGLQSARILEVGCGPGVVVKQLRDAGFDCTGVELAAVTPLAEVSDSVQASTDALTLPVDERQQYNCLLLLDVIEHLPQPEAFVAELRAAFPNINSLLITVPARQELWSNYDEYYGHYRRYSLEDLGTLAQQCQAQLAQCRYFFRMLYPLAWLLKTLGRDRETRLNSPKSGQLAVHRLVSWLARLDYRLLPGRVPGSSAIACLRW